MLIVVFNVLIIHAISALILLEKCVQFTNTQYPSFSCVFRRYFRELSVTAMLRCLLRAIIPRHNNKQQTLIWLSVLVSEFHSLNIVGTELTCFT